LSGHVDLQESRLKKETLVLLGPLVSPGPTA